MTNICEQNCDVLGHRTHVSYLTGYPWKSEILCFFLWILSSCKKIMYTFSLFSLFITILGTKKPAEQDIFSMHITTLNMCHSPDFRNHVWLLCFLGAQLCMFQEIVCIWLLGKIHFQNFLSFFSVQLYTIHPGVESNPNVGITTFQTAIVRKGELNNLERLEKSRFLKTN